MIGKTFARCRVDELFFAIFYDQELPPDPKLT
jgi:hypothetical protein